MAAREGKAGSESGLIKRSGTLAAKAHLSAANVKPRCGGRSHKRAAEKEREWQRDEQRLMRSER